MTQRRTDPDVVQRIREMAGEGFTGPAIERVLSGDPEYADRTPSLRTIQDIAREQPVHSEWWSVAEASPEEARLVLPVLAERIRYLRGTHGLRGTVRIAKGLGGWIAKVRAIRPDMPPGEAYRTAWKYWLNPSPELDEALAMFVPPVATYVPEPEPEPEPVCEMCGRPYRMTRHNKRFCSERCGQRAGRLRRGTRKAGSRTNPLPAKPRDRS